jgi:hypothetical protein
MAFDITNPATYSKDFKNLLRQKGYAGKKDVPVEELEALYVDYSGKQEQDTKVATNLLSSVASDPAPYTSAMASQDTFQGDQSFDLTQINNQGGSGPIFSTVQAVDEQAALRRQQSEQAAAQPDPNDQFRMVVQDRILPAIDAIKQKRSSAAGIKNTWERKMQQDSVDQLAATRINDLVASGLINSQDAGLIMKRADESKGLTYEESLRGFLFDRMNPQQQTEAGVSVDPETAEALKVAVDVYKTAESAAELRADDPAARRAADDAYRTVQNVKKKAGLSVEVNPVEDYKTVLRDVKFLQNAQNDDTPRVTLNDQVIEEGSYGDALLGLQTKLGTIMASPEFREKLPVIDRRTFETPEDYQAAIRKAGQLYLDENGQVMTPDIFAEKEKKARFTTFKPKENEPVPSTPMAEQPANNLSRANKNLIRRMIQEGKDSTNTNFKPTPEMIASVREEMNEEQIESALRSLYAGNSWANKIGFRNPTIKDEDMSGVLGRTEDPEAAKFLSEIDPEVVKQVYEKADRLQGFSARGLKNEDGTWSQKVDTPDKVLSRIRALASKRGK